MRPYILPALLLAASALTVNAAPASAQTIAARDAADDWMDNCKRNESSDRETFCELREVSLPRDLQELSVNGGENGGVSFFAWDRDEVRGWAVIRASGDTEQDAEDVAHDVTIDQRSSELRANGPSQRRHQNWSVTYAIMVPRHMDLRATTHNGPVAVRGVSSRMDLSADNGPVSLSGVGGDVRARVQNGPLDVVLTGNRWEGKGLDAETQNGPVVLRIPRDYSARLETGTINGPFNIDIPITIQGRVTRRISTTLGSGGAPVRAVTTNGPAEVSRSDDR
jgi:hypothetical protein